MERSAIVVPTTIAPSIARGIVRTATCSRNARPYSRTAGPGGLGWLRRRTSRHTSGFASHRATGKVDARTPGAEYRGQWDSSFQLNAPSAAVPQSRTTIRAGCLAREGRIAPLAKLRGTPKNAQRSSKSARGAHTINSYNNGNRSSSERGVPRESNRIITHPEL